jgi:hypothetical protein
MMIFSGLQTDFSHKSSILTKISLGNLYWLALIITREFNDDSKSGRGSKVRPIYPEISRKLWVNLQNIEIFKVLQNVCSISETQKPSFQTVNLHQNELRQHCLKQKKNISIKIDWKGFFTFRKENTERKVSSNPLNYLK